MKTNRAAGALAPKVAARPARFMRVRAEPEKEPIVAASEPVTPPPPPPAKKAVTFGEAMAFSGSAPETINGRLAMLGFVAALGAEASSGETIFQQVADFRAKRNGGKGVVLSVHLAWIAGRVGAWGEKAARRIESRGEGAHVTWWRRQKNGFNMINQGLVPVR